MIASLSHPGVQEFIVANEHADENQLVLKQKEILGAPSTAVANQIKCRRKARLKLPSFYCTKGIVYPPSLNLEQSSSEATARYKASLCASLHVSSLVDLTGGFGVDSFFFSQTAEVNLVEPNQELLELARYNHTLLGAAIMYHHTTAEEFLASNHTKTGLIFLDPSRRTTSNQKVFRLADCEPNASNLQEKIFEHADLLLIKMSPLLDIQQGLRELLAVNEIHIVSVDNECKELLFLCRKGYVGEPVVRCVHLRGHAEVGAEVHAPFVFLPSQERSAAVAFADIDAFLFEPNSSVLKGGAFKLMGERFGLKKLHTSTHLYTNTIAIQDFPGRIFEILARVKLDKKLVDYFPNGYANIIVRNFPVSVEEIKKKTGLKEGGELFLICFSGVAKKISVVAKRVA